MQIMGILNITPNSFSDGGLYLQKEKAIAQARLMKSQGANIIDVGGESTAPGSEKIGAQEEWNRVGEILKSLIEEGIVTSFDSFRSENWKRFLELGGDFLNDVSGLEHEENEKIALLQQYPNAKVCIMFSRNIETPDPISIIQEINTFFEKKLNKLVSSGIARDRIIIDPGMGGFLSKNPQISFEVLNTLAYFKKFNCPILVGTSRKNFLSDPKNPSAPSERDIESVISSLLACQNGANIVRIHNVAMMRQAYNIFSQGQWKL